MISCALLLPLFAAVIRAEEILITVGADGKLAYNPQNVTAQPGDRLTFQFHPKNHSVTQASFENPCEPLADTYGNPIGFNSGFMPVSSDASIFPNFTVTVNDTSPIWVYCAQPGPPSHCGSGMVFSANAPLTGNTFDAFKAAAIAKEGGASVTSSATSSSASAWTSPPAPVIETVTATVTVDNSVYTTTYDYWSGASPDPTPNAQPSVHTVIVGGTDGLVYKPPTVTASINDVVLWEYHAKNHTVTQSDFNSPCTKNGGFDSGFMPVSANATLFPTFNITVNTTEPIWVYCRQPGPPAHCSSGMVFAINPPTTGNNTFEKFLELAEHTNVSTSASTSTSNTTGSSNSGSGQSSSGAGRVAASTGFSMGVIGVMALALL